MRVLRGSGAHGLTGMAPVRPLDAGRLRVVRPLLALHPEALRAFNRAHALPWREDPTNQAPGTRNDLRRRLLDLEARAQDPCGYLAALAERLRRRLERRDAGLRAAILGAAQVLAPGGRGARPARRPEHARRNRPRRRLAHAGEHHRCRLGRHVVRRPPPRTRRRAAGGGRRARPAPAARAAHHAALGLARAAHVAPAGALPPGVRARGARATCARPCSPRRVSAPSKPYSTPSAWARHRSYAGWRRGIASYPMAGGRGGRGRGSPG